MNVPDDLRYSSDHEWVRVEGELIRVGITDYAQDALGDVVYVAPPINIPDADLDELLSIVAQSVQVAIG